MTNAFIAIDWGTTNRRAYRIEAGRVLASERDDRGAAAMVPGEYPAEVETLRRRLGDLPILIAGMAGSRLGWREIPYVAAPAALTDLATAAQFIDPRTALVPGVSWQDGERADVMRGEEVQLLGAAAAGLVPARALLCQPGTHCKWAEMADGRIVRFTTAMSGEIFALIRQHSLLAPQMSATAALPTAQTALAFDAGVREGARRDLGASLFAIRARAMLGRADAHCPESFASGLLIGSDVAARLEEFGIQSVHILADPALGGRYARAITLLGGSAVVIDSHAAFLAGAARIGAIIL